MRLLVSLFVAGIASSVFADADRAMYLRGNGECGSPMMGAVTCSLSYLWGGDGQFKLSIVFGEEEPTVISATLKVEPYWASVRDDQGNQVGGGARDGKRVTISFPWAPEGLEEGQETGVRVLLSKEFLDHEDGYKVLDLSGSLTFPSLGSDPFLTFKGRSEIDPQITACLVAGKKPADCGV